MVTVPEMAAKLQRDAARHARATVAKVKAAQPDLAPALERNADAVEAGIQAGIAGALLALMEHGILPGAFEDDK